VSSSTPLLRRLGIRRGPGTLYRRWESLRFLLTRDRRAVTSFLASQELGDLTIAARLGVLREFLGVTQAVRGYHSLAEILTVGAAVLERRGRTNLTVVECGCARGSSTAKLSLVARRAGGRLIAFDSFQGIPDNDERHRHLDGREVVFRRRAFRGTISTVRRTVQEHGAPEVCELRKGLFEESLPGLGETIDVAFVDVDLLASVRTCLRELMPRLRTDGVLFSHDGHLRAVHDMLGTESFWRDEVGVPVPRIEGLGERKMLEIRPTVT
jgi:O-methyltransferase